MSFFFDSPIDRCELEDCHVLLDQTQEACAREHGCTHPHCPLASWFAQPVGEEPETSVDSTQD